MQKVREDLDDKVQYYYNLTDLNGDGKAEAIVYVEGPTWCGTSGCVALIFQQAKNDYTLVSEINLARAPIIISPRKTSGWHDIIMYVAGGGILPGYYTRLKFDGSKYLDNPTLPKMLKSTSELKGVAYIGEYMTSKRRGIVLHPADQRRPAT